MEPPAHEDPGVGDRPLGVIALATAAVRSISSFLHHGLIQTYSRLNVPTKCTPLEISLPQVVMDMVIFRTIFFELLVFFTFTLLTLHSVY